MQVAMPPTHSPWIPSCSPDRSQPEPELERSHHSFPGHVEATKGLCCGAVAPGVLKRPLPQRQAQGKRGCPLPPSPLTWSSGTVPQFCAGETDLLPTSCPLKQSQALCNCPQSVSSSVLVITTLGFVRAMTPVRPDSGLPGRHVLVKLRRSSEFRFIEMSVYNHCGLFDSERFSQRAAWKRRVRQIPNLPNLPCK